MIDKKHKRKTRGQKKAFIIGIISSVLTLCFSVGITISAINIPQKKDIDELYETNNLKALIRQENNSYLLTAVKEENDNFVDGLIYIYDKDNKLLQKTSLCDDAREKFGINDIASFDNCFSFTDTNSFFATSNNRLFYYTGLNEHNLTLMGYTDDFGGKINTLATNETDLYVISEDGSQRRIDRFDVGDITFTKKASGHIYQINSRQNVYSLECSKNPSIYSADVVGDYLYISTPTMIRKIHRDMTGVNYHILFDNVLEEEFEAVKNEHPDLERKEQYKLASEQAKEKCLATYGWNDYDVDTHKIEIAKTDFNANKFYFYHLPEMNGIVFYKDTFFYFDKKGTFYSLTIDELDQFNLVINYLEEELDYKENFTDPYLPLAEPSNCISYSREGDTCVIFYDGTSVLAVFDLKKAEIIVTVDIAANIYNAFYNEETTDFYYRYEDSVNRESGVSYLSIANVTKELTKKTTVIFLIIFIALTTIALITAILSWLSYLFKRVIVALQRTAKGLKKYWPIYIILFPSVFILCLFCYYPGISAMYTSFFTYKPDVKDIKIWNNFANYKEIFGNAQSLSHFLNMIFFLFADVVLAIIPPLIFAFFLTLMRHKKLSGVLRTLLFIPGIIPGIAGLLIWRTGIYGDYGLINSIIKAAGGETIYFFRSSDYMNLIWLILMGFPFVGSYLIFYGAMMNIPSSYYEAAELDGISVWKRFIKIDIPLCFPQIKYVLIMTIIASIQNFSRIFVAMGGTESVVNTPIVEMYMLMTYDKNYGLASAYATVIFVILFGLTYLSMRNRLKEK